MGLTTRQRVIVGGALSVGVAALLTTALVRGRGAQITIAGATPKAVAATSSQGPRQIAVYVTGAVQSPNVYYLPAGSRVVDAVRAAGGFSAAANPQAINLAAPLQDGEQVTVPFGSYSGSPQWSYATPGASGLSGPPQAALPAAQGWGGATAPSGTGGYQEPSAASGGASDYGGTAGPVQTSGPAAVDPTAGGNSERPLAVGAAGGGGNVSAAPRRTTSHRPPAKLQLPVHINTASAQELDALPHIGPALAGRIIAYRDQHGPFRRIEDLREVKGIGDKILLDIAPYLAL